MGNMCTIVNGTICYRNSWGQLHRDGDLPAVVGADGTQEWWVNGKPHRDGDLPAVVRRDGYQAWYKNNKLHRDGDLPAIVHADGYQAWYKNDFLHRGGDLPAVIWPNGRQEWWTNGKLHRDGDKPAVVFEAVVKEWWIDGMLHRDNNLPAKIHPDLGDKWYVHGKPCNPGYDWVAKLPDGTKGMYDEKSDTFIFENGTMIKKDRVVTDTLEQNEALICDMCRENKKCVALNCGHVYCGNCSSRVKTCPACRTEIEMRHRIFL